MSLRYKLPTFKNIASVESQKGIITIQRCPVENQKGAITVYGNSTLLVLNGTLLNSTNAILVLSRRFMLSLDVKFAFNKQLKSFIAKWVIPILVNLRYFIFKAAEI